MNRFERYLIDKGIYFETAGKYGRVLDKFLNWCKAYDHNPARLKRSDITDYLQMCREQGNKERTIRGKETVLQHYYQFLGTKRNPAKTWLRRRKEHNLPPRALEPKELINIYQSLKPKSPKEHRNRCILGMVLFQGIKRNELWEIRISDINFETAEVFVQGQLRSNSRKLKLEPTQMMHLYDYLHKYRKEFLQNKINKETDRFFLSMGEGERLNNVVTDILYRLKINFPQVIDLKHIRASVITHWEKQEGIIEAMHKAGHRYISSTARYQTGEYEELQDELKAKHPLEYMDV